MIEIRFHGRGGQGAVTAAELLAQAVIAENRYAQAFPNFGAERRGAPVTAYLRVSDSLIRLREKIERPDVVVILDPTLVGNADVLQGLREGGTVLLNTPARDATGLDPALLSHRLVLVDANRIALKTLGVPIANTAIIGAILQATGIAKLESLAEPVAHRFGRLGDKNLQAIQGGFEGTILLESKSLGAQAAVPGAQPAVPGAQPAVPGAQAAVPGTKTAAPATQPAAKEKTPWRPDALHAWKDMPLGGDITEPGNSVRFNTGNWRTAGHPATDYSLCIKCGLCWILCPDNAWIHNENGTFYLDERHCKGCGICVVQCPRKAIQLQGEHP